MPRAKVHPDARQRVAQACRQCKASKRKCNASWPCDYCVKRGLADVCEAVETESVQQRSSPSRHEHGTPHRNASSAHSSPTSRSRSDSDLAVDTTITDEPTHTDNNYGQDAGHPSVEASSPDVTRARMLSNNEGQYVFVGRSASLSFLELVRETVARCVGPCDFSEYASRDRMLEVDLDANPEDERHARLSPFEQQQCIDSYFFATTGLLDIMSLHEVRQLLQSQAGVDSYLAATRLLIIAIGVQVDPSMLARTGQIEKSAVTQARAMMFTSMLENPSLDMIRAFLLLSFYMLGACRRNAAFLYLGIAARAAYTLGLHTAESYAMLDEDKRHAQLKCWKSLVSLDLMTCSILGRTTAILAQRSNTDTVVNITESVGKEPGIELEAVYRLALLVDLISVQFNGKDPITAKTARSHLHHLRRWSDMLPIQLRPSKLPEDPTGQTRQSLLGCMHISCFYYFTVMLVTRPFLIIHVTQRLVKERSQACQLPTTGLDHETEELATACLHAATYMAQTCSSLLRLDLLLANMCMLKAWTFAAGLVLGFEKFARNGADVVLDEAFSSAHHVLSKFAEKSPQAAQYHEILVLLNSAVDKHRQMQRSRKPTASGSLVARIMDLHSQNDQELLASSAETNGDIIGSMPVNTFHDIQFGSGFGGAEGLQDNIGDFAAELDNFVLPSTESLMFDMQSFGTMPWGLT